jgi:hypothetical protein
MPKVLLIVNAKINEYGEIIPASPATARMIASLEKAIVLHSPQTMEMEVIANAVLWSNKGKLPAEYRNAELIYCPLTIDLPERFKFPARHIFQACQDVEKQRIWVKEHLGLWTSSPKNRFGDMWLPIIMTNKGPLYGEVIGEGAIPNSYQQPIDLSDAKRQALYQIAFQLLDHLQATPSVYLLQFAFLKDQIVFDRLWPFPAAPAIASLGVQQPDLFVCHWHCLINQPIIDIMIPGESKFRII